jgi:hypothetical protein
MSRFIAKPYATEIGLKLASTTLSKEIIDSSRPLVYIETPCMEIVR